MMGSVAYQRNRLRLHDRRVDDQYASRHRCSQQPALPAEESAVLTIVSDVILITPLLVVNT
jgi:hypothetical protein